MFSRLKQLKTYPFSLLLYLEWILLVVAGLGELPENFLGEQEYQVSESFFLSSAFPLSCLFLLGLIGLRLPKKSVFNKWLYITLQLLIIWLPTILKFQSIPLSTAFLVVIMRNCQIFGKSRECWIANAFVFISFIPSLQLSFIHSYKKLQLNISQNQNISLEEFQIHRGISHVGNLFFMGLSIAFIWILVNALLREYKSQQQLAIAREQLRLYALKAEDRAVVNERNRIAREIHDSVGHTLTAQTIQLNNAIAFWQTEPNEAYQFLTEAKELVKTALAEIRQSVTTLRADPLQGKSLSAAISLLFQEFSSTTGIMPNYNIDLVYSLAEETKLTIYRIVQEALTNIAKHSEATVVNVQLDTSDKNLYLSIEDNGQGFRLEQNTTGFGLQGMQERVLALNGELDISSDLDRGCTITITIPNQTLNLLH